jgi:hypothetical protein
LSVISSTGPLRAVRMSPDMHFPPKAEREACVETPSTE